MNKRRVLSFLNIFFLVLIIICILPIKVTYAYNFTKSAVYYNTSLKDDFYTSVNKEWLANTKIPEGSLSIDTFSEIEDNIKNRLIELINKNLNDIQESNSDMEKVIAFYKTILDTNSRNYQKAQPIKKYIDAYDNAKSIQELIDADIFAYKETGYMQLLSFFTERDIKLKSKYSLYHSGIENYFDKDIYLSSDILEAYKKLLVTDFVFTGEDKKNAVKYAQEVIDIEKDFSKIQLKSEEALDLNVVYNKLTVSDLENYYKYLDIKKVLYDIGYTDIDVVIVTNLKMFEKSAKFLSPENLESLKAYAKKNLIMKASMFLSDDFTAAEKDFEKTVFGGIREASEKEAAYYILLQYMPGYVGKIYAENYLSDKTKKYIEDIVIKFKEIYKTKINNADWLSEGAKKKACAKLEKMEVVVGYPNERADIFEDIDFKSPEMGGTFFYNVCQINKRINEFNQLLLGVSPDGVSYYMPEYTVNAFYNVEKNKIEIPAGILQYPLYDETSSYEENIGGIGVIIAHEMSHAFDVSGSMYDENGNKTNWWTDEDYNNFEEKCKAIVAAYDKIKIGENLYTNGTLTLSENIADLGGMGCAIEVLKEKESPDFKVFFKSWARLWKQINLPEADKYNANYDEHINGKIRTNRTIANFEEFYKAFDINESDEMYVKPSKRVKLW